MKPALHWGLRAVRQFAAHPSVRQAAYAVTRETLLIGSLVLLLRADLAAPLKAIAIAFASWRITAIGRRWNQSLAGAAREARPRRE